MAGYCLHRLVSAPSFLANDIILRLLALHENCDGEENNYPLRIAVEKLVNVPYSAISIIEPKPVVVFAVPDQRLHLTYERRRHSTRAIKEAQVSKHSLDSKPINIPSSISGFNGQPLQNVDIPLRKVLLNASVRFTHFIRTTDDMKVNFAWATLYRGAAIICHDVQVDLVTPVVFNRDNRMVKEEITGTFVRCKLRP